MGSLAMRPPAHPTLAQFHAADKSISTWLSPAAPRGGVMGADLGKGHPAVAQTLLGMQKMQWHPDVL